MNQSYFWKNFALGKELDIAGSFIFNGLRRLHEIETLYHESEVFEVVYNLSVGIERLLKVAVILIEHSDVIDQEIFERSLITHTHQELIRRVRIKHDLQLAGIDNEFLDLLGSFYKTHRYGRYAVSSVTSGSSEKRLLHQYVAKHLNIVWQDKFPFHITLNDARIKRFIGKRVGKLTTLLYDTIDKEATRLGTFTYELRSNSKAEKIFLRKKFDFADEDILWRELLVFIANAKASTGMLKFIRSIEPLDFDPGLIAEYIQCFASEDRKLQVLDEFESLYENVENARQRLEAISVIGASHVHFHDELDDDDWDEPDNA